jgi:hypothetical protein
MRLTGCKLQDYVSNKEHQRLRILPTELGVMILDKSDTSDLNFYNTRFVLPNKDFKNVNLTANGNKCFIRGKIMQNRRAKLSQLSASASSLGSLTPTPTMSLEGSYNLTRTNRKLFIQGEDDGIQFRFVFGNDEAPLTLLLKEVRRTLSVSRRNNTNINLIAMSSFYRVIMLLLQDLVSSRANLTREESSISIMAPRRFSSFCGTRNPPNSCLTCHDQLKRRHHPMFAYQEMRMVCVTIRTSLVAWASVT